MLIWPEKHFSQTFNMKNVEFDADSESLENFETKITCKKAREPTSLHTVLKIKNDSFTFTKLAFL